MKKYNPDIHKRRATRLQGYDYSQNGLYFVTICAKHREHLFGEIKDGKIRLNQTGQIAYENWVAIEGIFSNVTLHRFVVMPNHIHGIIEITPINLDNAHLCATNQGATNQGAINRAPTNGGGFAGGVNPMFHVNLARIIRRYKGRTSFECHKNHVTFAWQRNYYDHIIRNNHDYIRIAEYIENNPANWENDCFYP